MGSTVNQQNEKVTKEKHKYKYKNKAQVYIFKDNYNTKLWTVSQIPGKDNLNHNIIPQTYRAGWGRSRKWEKRFLRQGWREAGTLAEGVSLEHCV